MHTPLVAYYAPQNTNATSLIPVCFVLNQNVQPRYPATTTLVILGNYPRPFFMQKSTFSTNSSPTFGYDPGSRIKDQDQNGSRPKPGD
jgi:hypothetical protein